MFQPLSAFIGLRYTKAKKDNNYISFISIASVFGIVLGVAVLITLLSVMNGYVEGIQKRHLGMLSHVTISDSDWALPNWKNRRDQVLQNENVKAVAPFIEKQVLLKEADKIHPALLEAVLPTYEKDIGTINRYIKDDLGLNLLEKGAFNIILGQTMAQELGVTVGDSLTVLSPKQQNFAINNNNENNPDDLIPIIREFNVVGTFKVDLQTYDKSFAYIHLDDAAELFDMNENVTGLRAQINDIFKAKEVSEELASKSEGDFLISNWTTQFSSFFRAMQLTKTMLFLVLSLIIAVAAFNLISTLIMVVTDKESDIAILRTLGMSPNQVMKVFILQGGLLAIIGITIGVLLGLLIANNVSSIIQFLETTFNTTYLQADIHQITEIDAEIRLLDVVLISISTFVLSVLATLFPAWKASKVQPAEALRYE